MKIISFLLFISINIKPLVAQYKCEKDFFKTTYLTGALRKSVLLIWFPANVGTQNSLRLCSNETGLPLQRHCGYDRWKQSAQWEELNKNLALVNCSAITNFCKEETFEHNYIMKNGIIEPFVNKWKTSKVMELGDLQEPCIQSSGLPLTRRCEYSPITNTVQWEPLSPEYRNISCLRDTREKLITYDLNSLYKEVKQDSENMTLQPEKVVQDMTELLTNSQAVRIAADIKITGAILKILTENDNKPEILTGILNITDIIMASNHNTLIKAEKVAATSTILKTIDTYFHNMAKVMVPASQCHNTTDGIFYRTLKRTSIFYINPVCSNISGVAIYNKNLRHRHHYQLYDKHTGHYYRFLYLNQTLDEILSEPDLHLAAYIPLSLWNVLTNDDDDAIDNKKILTLLIFQNDFLFVNSTRMDKKPTGNILEISLLNYTGGLPYDIPFVFSYGQFYHKSHKAPTCGYWSHGTWITTGIRTGYKNISNNNLLICHSSHLTHFGAIFDISFKTPLSFGDTVILSISHDLMLDYISILGCSMSLVGLSCIWLTAICFRSFRVASSNKILLNMSFVLSLLMTFFLLLNLPDLWKSFIDIKISWHCKTMGAFLHYIVMVLFCWMLIIAVMQYQRYVKVLGYERPSNYMTKFSILAWGLPLIPVCFVALLEPNTYMPNKERSLNNMGLCYPSGNSLKYGVILPMAVIMLANLGIFIYIFFSLRRSLSQFKCRGDSKNLVIQIRVSILLFFLLGISWLFGLLSRFESSPVFSYIFCLTSTLQGFVLFIYAIIIDKSTRSAWIVLCCARSYSTMEDTNQVRFINSRLE